MYDENLDVDSLNPLGMLKTPWEVHCSPQDDLCFTLKAHQGSMDWFLGNVCTNTIVLLGTMVTLLSGNVTLQFCIMPKTLSLHMGFLSK